MSTTLYCGICGKAQTDSIIPHIRAEHDLSPAEYQTKCPGAPLFTQEFADYLKTQRVCVADSSIKTIKSLFGMDVLANIQPTDQVPAVDDKYSFDDDSTKAVLSSLMDNDRILMVGPTGSGKSSLITQLAARLNWPLRKINLHGEVSASDFIGQHKAKSGATYFQYGVLPTAMRNGEILVLEELDAATPEILFVLQGVLEEGGTLTIADNGGEIIHPHKDFRLVATANTLGLGDDSGMYTGTSVLNASHLDRWTAVFTVGYMSKDAETTVLCEKVPGIPKNIVKGMVALAMAVRKAADNEELYTTFSTRRLLALARKTKTLGIQKALEVAVLNKLPKTDRQVVFELAQRHIPGLMKESA